MNNAQLDMVLDYLNEGRSIDSNEYMIESLNELYAISIQESEQFISLSEDAIAAMKYKNRLDKVESHDDGMLVKIREAFKRFINWVKSIVTRIKIKIKQLSVNMLSKILEANIKKQKEIIKDIDPDAQITIDAIEYNILINAAKHVTLDKEKLKKFMEIRLNFSKDIPEDEKIEREILKMITAFAMLPYPVMPFFIKATDFVSDMITKKHDLYEQDKAMRTLTVGTYETILDNYSVLGNAVKNILKITLAEYKEIIGFAEELYKKDPITGNYLLSSCTNLTRFTTALASSTLQCVAYCISSSKKDLKKLRKANVFKG